MSLLNDFATNIALASGAVIATVILCVAVRRRNRREQRKTQARRDVTEVRGEKWDTCGRCGTLQDHCWCHEELKA